MERFGRSWDLLKSCIAVLREDKELLLFPVLSGLSSLLVLATFALPLFITRAFSDGFGVFGAAVGFAFYFSQYLVIFYFNAALVGAALKRLEGGNPTFSDGIGIANGNLAAILGYAAIAATVGMLLKSGRRRNGMLQSIVRSLAGMAWTLGTFLVVPVLVSRKIGPLDAIAESARLRHDFIALCVGFDRLGHRRGQDIGRIGHRPRHRVRHRPAVDRHREIGDRRDLYGNAVPLCHRRCRAGGFRHATAQPGLRWQMMTR